MTIRVAAIEVSHWHSVYDAAYLLRLAQIPEVRIAALHDPDSTIAAHRASMVGNPPLFTDYRQMLREVKPDLVVALGRHSAMAEVAHYLLDHGYPFIMEKPMGISAEEVLGIAEKADAKGAFVAVPLAQRYLSQVEWARQLVESGSFGPLSHFGFRFVKPTIDRYIAWGSPWMLDPATSGGGCLRNLGTHGFDIFGLLTGGAVEVVGAQVSSAVLQLPVEDYALVVVRSASGVIGHIEVGYTLPGEGRDDEMRIAGRDRLLVVRGSTAWTKTAAGEETVSLQQAENPYSRILREILDRWQRGESPPAGVWDCYQIARLTDQAYSLSRG